MFFLLTFARLIADKVQLEGFLDFIGALKLGSVVFNLGPSANKVGQGPQIESLSLSRDLAISASQVDYKIRPLQIMLSKFDSGSHSWTQK